MIMCIRLFGVPVCTCTCMNVIPGKYISVCVCACV